MVQKDGEAPTAIATAPLEQCRTMSDRKRVRGGDATITPNCDIIPPRKKQETGVMTSKSTRRRGFMARFVNALRPTKVYVARTIIPPFVPHGIAREENKATVSNALVGSGSFTLSRCRMVTAEEVAMRRARVLAHA